MDFDFNTSPNQNEGNNNDDQFGFSEPPKETNPSNNDGFQNLDFQSNPEQSQPKTTLDDMLNMNFQPLKEEDSNQKNDINLNMDFNMNSNKDTFSHGIDEEEQKRIDDRKKEGGNNIINTEKKDEIEEHFANMRISDVTVEKYLEENYGDDGEHKKSKKNKKKLTCTKCKDSSFNDRDELRQHCKTNWHKYNALQSAREGTSLSAEEYDEYVLMHPEELK